MGEEVGFPNVLSIHFSFSFITGKQDAAYPSNSIQLGTKAVSGSYISMHKGVLNCHSHIAIVVRPPLLKSFANKKKLNKSQSDLQRVFQNDHSVI